jgi:transposase
LGETHLDIYPRQERPWRDLLRRRAFLVRSRSAQLLGIHALLEQYTGKSFTASVMKRWTGPDIEEQVRDPQVALAAIAMQRVVKVLTAQIRHLEKEVVGHVKLRDEFRLLRTARGIGEAIALTIMCEVGDIRRFAKVGNFASYCRCVKTERLSNGKRKGAGNKRNGNPYLSWAFTEAAHFAVRFEPRAKRDVHPTTADRLWVTVDGQEDLLGLGTITAPLPQWLFNNPRL